jgi:4a-hydroxytetrahydrobiopterin dehydratase
MTQPDRRELLAKDDILNSKYGTLTWGISEKSLSRTFVFKDFTEAFDFMSEVAKIAEELDHHPDWSNSWNTVEISITNHQAGGITEVDLCMCARIEETAK